MSRAMPAAEVGLVGCSMLVATNNPSLQASLFSSPSMITWDCWLDKCPQPGGEPNAEKACGEQGGVELGKEEGDVVDEEEEKVGVKENLVKTGIGEEYMGTYACWVPLLVSLVLG